MMRLCRLIFRKTTGGLLVRIVYDDNQTPPIEQEINDFAILNGYNVDALTIIDLPESDSEFNNAVNATKVKLQNGQLIYEFIELPFEPAEPNPIMQINDKIDLLIQMYLEKEGII